MSPKTETPIQRAIRLINATQAAVDDHDHRDGDDTAETAAVNGAIAELHQFFLTQPLGSLTLSASAKPGKPVRRTLAPRRPHQE